MSDRPLASSANPRLKLARALATRRGREREGRFLLEGPKALAEALELAPGVVELVLWRTGEEERVAAALELARARRVPCLEVAARAFEGLSQVETPQPLLAVARQVWRELPALLGAAEGAPRAVVALAGVQDPGNVGTILRTAAFFGLAGAVFLPGSQDPWGPKVVRASAGALLLHPPAQAEPAALLEAARRAALQPVALVAHGGDPPAAIPARALLLLGAEGPGLPAALAAGARQVTIPGAGGAESLNVAVAFGVAAHCWRAAAGVADPS